MIYRKLLQTSRNRRGVSLVQIQVRVNGVLTTHLGRARLLVALPEGATVGDLLALLAARNPTAAAALEAAIPVVDGAPASRDRHLADQQEVSLLMPVAGG